MGSIDHYLDETVNRLNRYFEITPPPPSPGDIVFGRVPQPAWTERWIPDAKNSAWDSLGQRHVYGVTYHRMVGTLWGTDGWFRGGGGASGLTDFGVDATTGETLVWNDWRGTAHPGCSANRAGWASGPWQHGSPEGEAFVTAFGVNGINRDRASIEVSGNYNDPISEAGLSQIVAITAWLADQGKVTWRQYPMLREGIRYPLQHHDFQHEKPCAGAVLIGKMDEIAGRVRAILKQHQEGA